MHRRAPNDCAGTHGKTYAFYHCRGISSRRRTSFSSLKCQRLHGCQIIAMPGFSSFQESLALGSISIYIRAMVILLTISISVRHIHATDCTVSNLETCDCFKNSPCPKNSSAPRIVARKQDADLKVVVPNIITLRQFVNCSNRANVTGYSIDVFHAAIRTLINNTSNFSVHYTCFDFPSTLEDDDSTYNTMINLVANGTYDAVVGDVTIGYNRSTLVDFTQKYMESGIVMIGMAGNPNVSPWTLFIQPFELRLWGTILAVFACTGLLVCYLESDDHPELTEGGTVRRIGNILWFIVEALILLDRDYFRRTASRAAMIAWLFFAVLLGASYTAGLSSFLTFNNLNPSNLNILSLRNTTQNIGYRKGSIVKDIISRRFNFSDDRLVPLRYPTDFSDHLKNGSISKVLDELPYVNIMFSEKQFLDCQYEVGDGELTQQGFGFGFNKKRNLAKNFSKALTELSENGCLKNLTSCYNMDQKSQCSSDDSSSNKVPWRSAITIFVPLLFSLGVCVGTKYVKAYFQRKEDDTNVRPVIEDDSSVHLCRPTTPSRYAQEDLYRNEVELMKLM